MIIKKLQITSASTLDLDLNVTTPVCIIRGKHSSLALDLVREIIGDDRAENDPNRFEDGRFVICSDIEIDGKDYSLCYIRNADFIGDNRIAVNFAPGSLVFSKDDTLEFIDKCNERNSDSSNVLYDLIGVPACSDDRPLFVYLPIGADEAIVAPFLNALASTGRQVFVAADASYRADDSAENFSVIHLK